MPNAPLPPVATLGIDIGKNSFHLIGLDARGAIVLRQKLSRGQVEARLANMPSCRIGMEACVGAHHLSRPLLALGPDGKLIPVQFVKPFRKSHIGNGAAFSRGRDFGAWLGLVPRQTSTGDRTELGRLTKRGNSSLRSLLIQAARALLLWPAKWRQHSFGEWLIAASMRLHHNVLAAALANKLTRIAWSVLSQDRTYEPRTAAVMG